MRDESFQLHPSLFAPLGPFCAVQPTAPPWRWTVRDAVGSIVATARTRAGSRAAVRHLYAATSTQAAAA